MCFKKSIIIFLTIICCCPAKAQSTTIDNRILLSGDNIVKELVTPFPEGESGINCIWDISNIGYFNRQSIVSLSSLYPDSCLIVGTEGRMRYYYNQANDSLLLTGYEHSTEVMNFSAPICLLRLPLVYKDSIRNYFQGEGYFCESQFVKVLGQYSFCVDGFGKLILPDGDTLNTVTRVHHEKSYIRNTYNLPPDMLCRDSLERTLTGLTNQTIQGVLSRADNIIVESTFLWYANGFRYPIFEHTTLTWGANGNIGEYAYFCPPYSQQANCQELPNSAVWFAQKSPSGKRHGDSGKKQGNRYEDTGTSKYSLSDISAEKQMKMDCDIKSGSIHLSYDICTCSGIVLESHDLGTAGKGRHQYIVNLGNHPSGMYIIAIKAGREKYTEKVVIK